MDNGMVIGLSYGETIGATKQLRYFAGWADKIHGKTIPIGKSFSDTLITVFNIFWRSIPYLLPFPDLP